MASQSNVYPCSYSVSRLICHALTSLYFWLLILIFTSNVLTFILLWKHLFNANAPNQRELCTHSSFLLCPTNLTYLAFSQCIFVKLLCAHLRPFEMSWLCETKAVFSSLNSNSFYSRHALSVSRRLSAQPSRQTPWQTDMRSLTNRMSRWFHRMLKNVQAFIRSVVALNAH